MAVGTLEEKIIKIKLQNEEIKRRHEEVEADKKNAAKLNALVQMVPSSDWPERKEPPEFIRRETTKNNLKPKSVKEHSERGQQYVIGGVEGKKIHKFAQGDGPPPDPKYNFLADSEREENNSEGRKNEEKSKGFNKHLRNGPRRRGIARDGYQKDHRGIPAAAASRDGVLPEYDAWRAERNRIDEARISRQRTAEGNWRREWDNDKINNINMEKDSSTKDPRFSSNDINRRDHKEFERRHQFEGEHSNRGRGGFHRNPYGPKNFHGHYDNQHLDYSSEYSKTAIKDPMLPTEDRTVITTDKSIKVTVNQGVTSVKGPVMSIKVNAPSIAGTGRVGPRQKTRFTYSSQSEVETTTHPIKNFLRQKSFDEKIHLSNSQKVAVPKSPYAPRKKDAGNKSPFPQRKDAKREEQSIRSHKHGENNSKSPYVQKKEFKDIERSPQFQRRSQYSSTYGSTSLRGRLQNQPSEIKSNEVKISTHRTANNESIIEPKEISANRDVGMKDDQIIRNVENFRINLNDENTIDSKEIIEEIEKVDGIRGKDTESVNITSCEESSERLTMNQSIEFTKQKEKVSEDSNEISAVINVTERDNFRRQIDEKIASGAKINSEISCEEISELKSNLEVIEGDIISNTKELKDCSVQNINKNLQISKDTQKVELKQNEISENTELLDTKKMENINKNHKEVQVSDNNQKSEYSVNPSTAIKETIVSNNGDSDSESKVVVQVVTDVSCSEHVRDESEDNLMDLFLVNIQTPQIKSESETSKTATVNDTSSKSIE